ncbi:MAG: hypothetical protein R6X34_12695 [Chloroflexota bacterium]
MVTKTQTDKTIHLQKAFYANPAYADPFLALQEQVFPGLDLAWALGHSRLADFSIPSLNHFALNKFMPTCVWLDETADLLLVTAVEQNKLIIYDLIGPYFPENYLERLVWPGAQTLDTRFSPDLFHGDFKTTPYHDEEDQLFVYLCRENRVLEDALAGQFRVPAQAKT